MGRAWNPTWRARSFCSDTRQRRRAGNRSRPYVRQYNKTLSEHGVRAYDKIKQDVRRLGDNKMATVKRGNRVSATRQSRQVRRRAPRGVGRELIFHGT